MNRIRRAANKLSCSLSRMNSIHRAVNKLSCSLSRMNSIHRAANRLRYERVWLWRLALRHRIAVMSAGRLVGRGNHDSLIGQAGVYASLYRHHSDSLVRSAA